MSGVKYISILNVLFNLHNLLDLNLVNNLSTTDLIQGVPGSTISHEITNFNELMYYERNLLCISISNSWYFSCPCKVHL